MTTIFGETTFGRNKPGVGLLITGLAAATALAVLGTWELTKSDPAPAPAQPAAETRPFVPSAEPMQTYVYIVDNAAQKNDILRADFEAQAGTGNDPAFNHITQVIDISTPEGQEAYRLMNAELTQVAMEAPDYVSSVQVIDLTVPAAVPEASSGVPLDQTFDRPSVPTYFYVVDSQEEADMVLQAEVLSAQETMLLPDPTLHNTVIVDVSTLEGVELLNTINGDLHQFWDQPGFDPSLIQIIEVQ